MTTAEIIAQFNNISWREPGWLMLAIMPVLLACLSKWLRGRNKQGRYADAHLMPWASAQQSTSPGKRLLSKNTAFVLAWLLLAIAAAGPRLPLELNTLEQPANLDLMLVIDVSRSMRVTDIEPSRLRRAQIEIDELISRSAGNRFGIIVFAARPHLLAPLTSDISALRFYLRTLDNLRLPTSGSEPRAALALAESELKGSTNPSAILLLSDGDFATTADTTNVSAQTSPQNTPLYVLGIGTSEGAAIPLENGQWLKHDGQAVISRLNKRNLQWLIDSRHETENNEKRYSPATDDNRDWETLYDDGIARLGGKPVVDEEEHNIIWQQLYHWPLCIAALLLWVSLLPYRLPYRIRRRLRSTTKLNPANVGAKLTLIFCSLLLLALYPVQKVFADPDKATANISSSQAYQNYRDKNYAAAISIYKQLPGYNARFGEGASHYKQEDYFAAIRQFSRALLDAESDRQRADALFNLGNSYFQTGNYADAITAYSDTLKYQPAHKHTRYNLDFSIALKQSVEKRLRRNSRTARMGSGPQLSPSAESINTNQAGSLAIDESQSQKPSPLPELATLSNNTLETLINKGLSHIQLAASQNSGNDKTARQRHQLSLINTRLRMSELEDEHTLLWKRLYEMEEGFPAPLAEPRTVPGVAPW